MSAAAEVLRVDGLRVRYPRAVGDVLADVELSVHPGEIVGVIGETGSGKTTLARAVLGLVEPVAGQVRFEGRDIAGLRGRARQAFRRAGGMQLVFQDPLRSLDPDLTVEACVAEGLDVRGGLSAAERRSGVEAALRLVGLDPALAPRRPGELSGGQRQRVALARAMVLEPRLLLCDEPVSALDASSRNHVLRTLGELRERTGLAILVISHDLASLAGLADRVVVLYRGRIVEEGPIGDVLSSPGHPYTALLVASAPHVARARLGFDLEPHQLRRVSSTSAGTAAAGCVFAPRCRFATEECRTTVPPIRELEPGRRAACFHAATWPLDARAERIPA